MMIAVSNIQLVKQKHFIYMENVEEYVIYIIGKYVGMYVCISIDQHLYLSHAGSQDVGGRAQKKGMWMELISFER